MVVKEKSRKKPEEAEQEEKEVSKSALCVAADACLNVERRRVACQVRLNHLAKRQQTDPFTAELLRRYEEEEQFADGVLENLTALHPAYDWFSKIKGIGKENIGKPLGKMDVHKAPHISSFWKFCGFHVVDGHAPKPIKGKKLDFVKELRTLWWRVGTSLMKAGIRHKCVGCNEMISSQEMQKGQCPNCSNSDFINIGISWFGAFYLERKKEYYQRYINKGWQIVKSEDLPTKDGKKHEPEGVISEGHIHQMAMRKMIKRFLAGLWLVWRKAEGLPLSNPYVIDKLGHQHMDDPWDMIDVSPTKGMRKRSSANEAVLTILKSNKKVAQLRAVVVATSDQVSFTPTKDVLSKRRDRPQVSAKTTQEVEAIPAPKSIKAGKSSLAALMTQAMSSVGRKRTGIASLRGAARKKDM